MFKKFENIIYYHGRYLKHPLTLSDKLFIIWDWITMPFRKWKLVNVFQNRIVPYSQLAFILSDKEKEAAEKIYKEQGTIDYIIYPMGVGLELKVRVHKTGEEIDITDLDSI